MSRLNRWTRRARGRLTVRLLWAIADEARRGQALNRRNRESGNTAPERAYYWPGHLGTMSRALARFPAPRQPAGNPGGSEP